MNPEVMLAQFGKEDVPATTSLNVAEVFGKRHKNVLRAIESMECSEEFRRLNFEPSTYTNEQGKEQPMYVMTRDGFTILVMGFTGRPAMQYKEAYIKAFNRMEKELERLRAEEQKKLVAREAGKLARRTLTDEIRDSGEVERMHGHAYSTYTQLIHKAALGEPVKKTRERLWLGKKDNIRDRLTAQELKRIEGAERTAAGMLAMGATYDLVKATLSSIPQLT